MSEYTWCPHCRRKFMNYQDDTGHLPFCPRCKTETRTSKLKRGGLYRVKQVSLWGMAFHAPQGAGSPAVGDTVRIGTDASAIFEHRGHEVGWGIEVNDRYGANFYASMLEEMNESAQAGMACDSARLPGM